MASEAKPASADARKKKKVLSELKAIIKKQNNLFACGGNIPLIEDMELMVPKSSLFSRRFQEYKESNPVTIRWDVSRVWRDEAAPSVCARLTLPLGISEPRGRPGGEADLNRLIQGSHRVQYRLGDEDIYDERYCKGLMMKPDRFCTTFDPYSLGIIDIVAQVLLPTVADSPTHHAVRAELDRLNIYSAPDGKFKHNAKNPWNEEMFGFLVVRLPLAHEGGQLKVRRKGKEIEFDWSTRQGDPDRTGISWAAFYSDCEYEVIEVTSGHQLTLTYKLYVARGAGRLTGASPTLNPAHLPLYQAVKDTLSQEPFGSNGGTLGFWCSHGYPHNDETDAQFPAMLKGLDAVLWETFRALGLDPRVAPVITMNEDVREHFVDDIECRGRPPSRYVIGRQFGIMEFRGHASGYDGYDAIFQRWGAYSPDKIHWLTEPGESKMQVVYTAADWGETRSETMYSDCAILVRIPPIPQADEDESDTV